jgi:hypothetical protein
MVTRAKSFTDAEVISAIRAGKTVVLLDSGNHGDDDLFLCVPEIHGDDDMTVAEAEAMLLEYLEVDELPEDYRLWVADGDELRAILWDMEGTTEDDIDDIMGARAAAKIKE